MNSAQGEAIELRLVEATTPLMSLPGSTAITVNGEAAATVTYAATEIVLDRNILVQDAATIQFVADSLYVGSDSTSDFTVIDTRDAGKTEAASLAFYGRNIEFENVIIIAAPVDNITQFSDDNSTTAVATVLGAAVTSESHRDQLIAMAASAQALSLIHI